MKNFKYVCIITFISVLMGIIFLYYNLYIISAQTPLINNPENGIIIDKPIDTPILPPIENKIYNSFPKIAKQNSSGYTQQIGGSNEDVLFYQYSYNEYTYFGGYSSSDDYDIKNQSESLIFFKMNNNTGEIDKLYTLPIGNKCEFVKSSNTAIGIILAIKCDNSFVLIKCDYSLRLEILETVSGYDNYDFLLTDKKIYTFASKETAFSITEYKEDKSKNTVEYTNLGKFVKIINNVNTLDVFYIKENATHKAEFDGVVLKKNEKMFDYAIEKIEQISYKTTLHYIFSTKTSITTTDAKYNIINQTQLTGKIKYIYLEPIILIFQSSQENEKESVSIFHFDLNLLSPNALTIDKTSNVKTAFNKENQTSYILATIGRNTFVYSFAYLKLSVYKSYENTSGVSIDVINNRLIIGLNQKATSVLSTYNNSIDILIISEKL